MNQDSSGSGSSGNTSASCAINLWDMPGSPNPSSEKYTGRRQKQRQKKQQQQLP